MLDGLGALLEQPPIITIATASEAANCKREIDDAFRPRASFPVTVGVAPLFTAKPPAGSLEHNSPIQPAAIAKRATEHEKLKQS
jgi:hypothetical protein